MSATETPPAKPAADPPASPAAEAAKPVAPAPAAPAAEPAESPASEFAPVVPELQPGGTVVVGTTELQLQSREEPGVEVRIHPVKTRQLLRIGRILTGETRPINLNALIAPLVMARTELERDASVVAAIANVMMTVPHSENEFLDLLLTLCDPVNKITDDEMRAFVTYMLDPELTDTTLVLFQMLKNEQPRFVELGKALMTMFPQLGSVGRLTQETPETPSDSPGSPAST